QNVLQYMNDQLTRCYASLSETFVTAFYGVYCPHKKTLRYACAGHNPPLLKRCQDGSLLTLDAASGLPLGISTDATYNQAELTLQVGDQLILYTDGITEASNRRGELFGEARLDQELENCALQASHLLESI